MSVFAKPENALKRANELLTVGQKEEALDALRAIIVSRRHRVWSKSLEEVMMKYIEIAVDLRKGQEAKDGLHQYRGICQQVNVGSLGAVVKKFLDLAESKAKEAQQKAENVNLEGMDLDSEPESVMLGRVSGEDQKDRTDREIVTPWLKFLWETYRTVLDILRNNAKLESLYQKTAQQAFAFCKRYTRTVEFRRLSELLRNHLQSMSKFAHQPHSVSLQSPESLQLHLETRFSQLNVACDLELWQEAFRSIEDIHGLMVMSKKSPKPQMMANYYEKLAQIFWVSNNYLFHAYAWNKFHTLSRNQNKSLTPDELKIMASQVLLAALAIPIDTPKSEDPFFDIDDITKEKNQRLTVLLGPTSTPKRETLLSDLVARGILSQVLPELADLYNVLEVKFHPLQLCTAARSKLEFAAAHPSLKQYTTPLQNVLLVRQLQQLAKVYQTMRLQELYKLTYFAEQTVLEKSVVEIIKRGHVDAHIDHKNGALHFGRYTLESDKLKTQLTTLAKGLQRVAELVQPENEAEKEERKRKAFAVILKNLVKEHNQALERKRIIEKRKEIKEQMTNIKAVEQAKSQQAAAEAAAAAARAQREKEEKETAIKREQELKEQQRKKEQEEKEKKDKERADALNKAHKELESKMSTMAKKLDHLERAKREEERPLLEQEYEKQQEEGKKYYEQQKASYHDTQLKAHSRKLEEKKRLARMDTYRKAFEAQIMARRTAEYEEKKMSQDERLVGIRAQLAADKEKRQKEISKRKAREEQARKEREEREKKQREEEEKQREEAEKVRKVAAEKREREEAEARQKEEERRAEREKRDREERERRPAEQEREPERRPFERSSGRDERPAGRDERDDSWGRGPARREPEPARRAYERPAGRDERPAGRDERPAGRDERPAGRDERPAGRDERDDSWGRGPARREPEPERRPFERTGGRGDDRRDDNRRPYERPAARGDDRRDDNRRPYERPENDRREGERRFGDDRRSDDRGGRYGDRDRAPARGGDDWSRGGPRRDERPAGRDERPRRDERDDRPPRRDERDDRPPRRDERDAPRRDEREERPPRRDEREAPAAREPAPQKDAEDDGWSTVRKPVRGGAKK